MDRENMSLATREDTSLVPPVEVEPPWPYIDRLREDRRRFGEGMAAARIALDEFLRNPTIPEPWEGSDMIDQIVEAARDSGIQLKDGYLFTAQDELIGAGELVPTGEGTYKLRPTN